MTQAKQGLSLLDIGAPHEIVKVGEHDLQVFGLSVENLVELLTRFPEAGQWLAPGAVNMQAMIKVAPKLLQAVIALATTTDTDHIDEAEKVAAKLAVETQIDVLDAIVRLTFKDGFGPFVERIAGLLDKAASVNFGRVTATKSQPQSSTSSPADTTAEASGS